MKQKSVTLFGIRKRAMIYRTKDKTYYNAVYMEAITEGQELAIDKTKGGDTMKYVREDGTAILGNDIYLYGRIDFDDEDDLANIRRYGLVDDTFSYIESGFDYDKTDDIVITEPVPRRCPTIDPVLWFKYNHYLLGKPERVIVYRKLVKRGKSS